MRHGHVLDGFRVKSQNAKVVNRISVDWVCVYFFVVVEYDIAPKRPRSNNMAICHDISIKVSATEETPSILATFWEFFFFY